MKKVFSSALLSIVAFALTSCATSTSQIAFHEETTKDQNDVIVYIYRLPNIVGAAVDWSVKFDGKEVAVLQPKTYAVLHTTPGAHTVKIGDLAFTTYLDVSTAVAGSIMDSVARNNGMFTAAPNGVYFFRSNGFVAYFVTKEEAMKEIVDMKYDIGPRTPPIYKP